MNGANRKWSGLSWTYGSRRYKLGLCECDCLDERAAMGKTTKKQLWILWYESSLLTAVITLLLTFLLTQPIK